MSREKQIEEMARDVTRSICWCNEEIPTVDGMGTAITLYNKGYRKASEVVEEIADFIWEKDIASTLLPINGRYLSKQEFLSKLKKKYTQGIDSIVGIEWHCEEGWKPTDTLKLSGDEKFVDENGEQHGYSEWYKESEGK